MCIEKNRKTEDMNGAVPPWTSRSKDMGKGLRCMITLLMMISTFVSCSKMESDWRTANAENSVEAYRTFLSKYNESPYMKEAMVKIENLEWTKLGPLPNEAQLQNFLVKYPAGSKAMEARARMEEIAWKNCEQADNIVNYEHFISTYTVSKHRKTAEERIGHLATQKVDEALNLFLLSRKLRLIRGYDNDFSTNMVVGPAKPMPVEITEIDGVAAADIFGTLTLQKGNMKGSMTIINNVYTMIDPKINPGSTIFISFVGNKIQIYGTIGSSGKMDGITSRKIKNDTEVVCSLGRFRFSDDHWEKKK